MTFNQNRVRVLMAGLCVAGAMAQTGCSAFQTSHILEPDAPAVSANAVASADGVYISEPFSLVAADAVGFSTFGWEVALLDQLYANESLAEAQ